MVGLRSPPRVVDASSGGAKPVADLSRAWAPTGRLRQPDGLHTRGVPAGDGAPVLWLVGIPGDRVLRADQPLWNSAGLHVPCRLSAPERNRGDPRLGPIAFSIR